MQRIGSAHLEWLCVPSITSWYCSQQAPTTSKMSRGASLCPSASKTHIPGHIQPPCLSLQHCYALPFRPQQLYPAITEPVKSLLQLAAEVLPLITLSLQRPVLEAERVTFFMPISLKKKKIISERKTNCAL